MTSPTPRELADKKLERLTREWDELRAKLNLPRPSLDSQRTYLCLGCGRLYERDAGEPCPACTGTVAWPILKRLRLEEEEEVTP